MKKIYKLFVIMALLFGGMTAKAQNDGITMTLLPHLSYNNYYNPSVPTESKVVLGLGISNLHFSVYNSSIKYNNLYNFENGVPVTLNANQFINSLDEHDNFINTNFSIDLARVGVKFGKLFVDLDWRLRYNGEFHYSRDFLGFFINGNGHYLGQDNPADFSIGADVNIFSEFGVGLQYSINEKLSVGIRPKLLCGVANLSVNDDQTYIYTDPDTYEMTADININIKAATAFDVDPYRMSEFKNYLNLDSIGLDDLLNFKENYGFGIDFGATYTFNKHIGVSAGVYDLGFVKWTETKEKHNHKDNVVVNDALIDDINDVLDMNLDLTSLYEGLLEDIWDDDSLYHGEDYKTSLKTRIMLQGYYELLPMARFTAIGQMYYVKDKFRPALTLAYSGSFFRFLNLTASYTASKYVGNSIGAGVSLNLGPLNVYAVTDNIMILTKMNASTIESVTSYKSANVRLGVVFTLGKVKK
ncbi:MAG: hypothetical protein IJZ87_06355 [Bacteroidales bacterium]|nr:hypothetical protein [Bacteroidales bacterium]